MTTKLTDVIHFYLGCECIVDNDKKGIIYGIKQSINIHSKHDCHSDFTSIKVMYDYNKKGMHEAVVITSVKPILRSLDSMTEEQKLEACRIQYGRSVSEFNKHVDDKMSNYYGHISKKDAIQNASNMLNIKAYIPELTKYLLSIHMDLFGLIESGQAIDKNKM